MIHGYGDDPDYPLFETVADLRGVFRRIGPFVDDKPRRVRFEPVAPAISEVLGDYDALREQAGGDEEAAREIIAELVRRAEREDDAPTFLLLPSGAVALLRFPAAPDPEDPDAPLRAALYLAAEPVRDVDGKVQQAALAILLGVADLYDEDEAKPEGPLAGAAGVEAALDVDALASEFAKQRGRSGAKVAPPRRGLLVENFKWLNARRPALTARGPMRPKPAPRVPEPSFDIHDHVVNLDFGALSSSGGLVTRPADIDDIATRAVAFVAGGSGRRILLYAHGGLVPEASGVAYAAATVRWWLTNGVYPIFCVWESDALNTLLGMIGATLGGSRGLDDLRDQAIERLVNTFGVVVWDSMKASAAADSGEGGGLTLLTRKLAEKFDRVNAGKAPDRVPRTLHLVGHSAGAIVHLHLLARLAEAGLEVPTLQLLAPAATTALFEATAIAAGTHVRIYAMSDPVERADPTCAPYGKSLLYLVRNGFERRAGTPILGLQADLLADSDLVDRIARDRPTRECLVFSETGPGVPPRLQSRSRSHGGFDNDAPTMESVATLIRGAPPVTDFPAAAVADRGATRGGDSGMGALPEAVRTYLSLVAATAPPDAPASRAAVPAPAPTWAAARGGTRRLLSMGVEPYPVGKRLLGCVNDSNVWRARLKARGFEGCDGVPPVWTRQTIIDELTRFVASGRAGDTLVWHYSGHGIEVAATGPGDDLEDRDQAIVGANQDAGNRAQEAHAVFDDELYAILQRVADGVQLCVFLDCCCSGSGTRFEFPGTPRTMGLLRVPNYRPRRRPLVGRLAANADGAYDAQYASARHILFSACAPSGLAGEDGPGQVLGHFTRQTWAVLDGNPGPLTNERFVAAVRDQLRNTSQVPDLFGQASRGGDAFALSS